MRYFIVISPNPMFRYSGLGFLTASVMLDPYYVVTLIRDFSAFYIALQRKSALDSCANKNKGGETCFANVGNANALGLSRYTVNSSHSDSSTRL